MGILTNAGSLHWKWFQCAPEVFTFLLLMTGMLCRSVTAGGAERDTMPCPTGWKIIDTAAYHDALKGMCVWASYREYSWAGAVRSCEAKSAKLVIARDISDLAILQAMAEDMDFEEIWVNGKRNNTVWAWDHGKKRLQIQGCWEDDPDNRDLRRSTTQYAGQSVVNCINTCKSLHYTIAGLQMGKDHTPICRCDHSFGKHRRKKFNDCRAKCPDGDQYSTSPLDNLCGGIDRQVIFDVTNLLTPSLTQSAVQTDMTAAQQATTMGILFSLEAEVAFWEGRQGDCASLANTANLSLIQENCQSKKAVICQYDYAQCHTLSSTMNVQHLNQNKCATVHNDVKITWFEARQYCLYRQGYLLEIEFSTMLQTWRPDASRGVRNWWVGLTMLHWTTSTGTTLPAYNGWRRNEPSSKNMEKSCVQALRDDSYLWSVAANCNEKKHYFCVRAAYLAGIPPSSVEEESTTIGLIVHHMTPFKLDPFITKYPKPDRTTAKPQNNANQRQTIIIGAIGAGCGVGFVLVVLCVVFCCRRCNNSSTRESSKKPKSPSDSATRRLPSIPHGGKGARRGPDGKEMNDLSYTPTNLNHMPLDDDDDGGYDYINFEIGTEGTKDGEGVTYQPLKGSTREKEEDKEAEEYMDLSPRMAEEVYVVPVEPPAEYAGIVRDGKPPQGMSQIEGKVNRGFQQGRK